MVEEICMFGRITNGCFETLQHDPSAETLTPHEARVMLGMTKAQMSRALVVHRNTWAKWESGERRIPAVAVTVIELCLWLHCYHPDVWDDWINK